MQADTRLVASIVAGAFFMQLLDGTIINTSLPQMAQSFGVTPVGVSIGITIYLMSAVAIMPLSGWLADRFGSRNVFTAAIAVFTVASLCCGLARGLTQFGVARAVQGVGGALMTPVGRLVVLRSTQKSELLHAIALITWPALAAPVVAPALGGLITTYISWRWNFLLNVPLGALGAVLALRFVPNTMADTRPRMDWRGFVYAALSLTALLYGLQSLTQERVDGWLSGGLISAGTALAIMAIRHFSHARHPLLQLSAARVRTYAMTSISAGLAFRAAISATPFLLPLLFQLIFGLSALASGMLVLVYFVGNMGIKPLTTPILRRVGFRTVLVVNGVLAGLAIMACALLTPQTPRALVVVVLLLAGMTRSMQFTGFNSLAFADISAEQRSSAATLSSVLEQVAAVLGVASGAIVLNLCQRFWAESAVSPGAFRIAFMLAGITAAAAALSFRRLHADAGIEISGHRAGRG
ncbi:MAG TPA: MFS transporter [Steroidobacteraceae bacterium]|nr:MFS transporter [Steroidobacteraceae bacterium]